MKILAGVRAFGHFSFAHKKSAWGAGRSPDFYQHSELGWILNKSAWGSGAKPRLCVTLFQVAKGLGHEIRKRRKYMHAIRDRLNVASAGDRIDHLLDEHRRMRSDDMETEDLPR